MKDEEHPVDSNVMCPIHGFHLCSLDKYCDGCHDELLCPNKEYGWDYIRDWEKKHPDYKTRYQFYEVFKNGNFRKPKNVYVQFEIPKHFFSGCGLGFIIGNSREGRKEVGIVINSPNPDKEPLWELVSIDLLKKIVSNVEEQLKKNNGGGM